MARSSNPAERDAGMNPLYMILGLGAGTALIIALVIAMTENAGGDVVSSGPETEAVDLVDEGDGGAAVADDEGDGPAYAIEQDEPGENVAEGAPVAVETAAPDGDEPVGELSGNAVSPEDTDVLTEPAGDAATTAVEGATSADGEDAGDAGAVAVEPMADDAAPDPETDLDTSIVVDPDRGGGDGEEPDGGAAPFFPEPSGPEGSDGDPLTAD